MAFKDNFKKFIENQVEATIDLIFANAHGYAMTESGDIYPEQVFELDELKQRLKDLVYQQTVDNLTEEQKKQYHLIDAAVESEEVLWNVPVMRTGYGHTLIAVTASTEQEAINKALDEAGGESFSEKSSEYTAPDGAHRIG